MKNENITVCSECLTERCWKGEFYCSGYLYAGTVEIDKDTKKVVVKDDK